MEESMRKIFNESQSVHKHNTAIRQLSKLQKSSNTVSYLSKFYEELIRNIKLTLNCESRSPFANNTIDFIIKYLLTFSPMNGENYYSPENESNVTLMETVLKDVIKPYLYNLKVECRINACIFVRKLFDELDDINEELFKQLKRDLIQRCADKSSSVRAFAFLALHRFQDLDSEKDIALTAIQFHLKNDPDSEVRHNCLKTIAPSKSTLNDFIYATRDVKDFIRKTAFIQIADKLQMKCFTIEQRLTILKNGLKDRSPAVRKVVETVLIPSWVKSCNNDLVQLLIALDIQTDLKLIEQMLDVYFKQLNRENISKDSSKTKFQALVDEFRDKYLDNSRIFKVPLNVENVFLWRHICEFCKLNQLENETIETTEQQMVEEQEVSENQNLDTTKETFTSNVDLVDLLVPDVPYYCDYLKKFINHVISQEFDLEELMDFEFIYNQIMRISLLFDIGDESQRKKLLETMRFILINNQVCDKFHSYINPIMKCLAKSGFADKFAFLEFTVEIISEIFALILSSSDENDSISEEIRELDEKYEKLTAELNKHKEELIKCEAEEKLTEAENVKILMSELQLEIDQLNEKINSNTFSQSSQSSQKSLPSFVDHPKPLLRCLHIFSGCLEFGDFTEDMPSIAKSVMQTHIEKVCFPGFLSEDVELRIVATRCLGLFCLISPQNFKKYLHLLIEVFLKDLESIKLVALKSIFDSLCEHGINIFEEKSKENDTRDDKKSENESTNEVETERSAFIENDEDFITSLKNFFETQLDSESDEIKYIAAKGIAKLLILCKMYSSQLLSKLIIIWYNPQEKQILLQFIGDFLRVYAFAESQGVIVGQSALEEAFFITLETVFNDSIKHINTDNLIKFFLNLIVEESHAKLVIQLANKIIGCDSSQRKLAEEFFLPALSQLNFIGMESKEMKTFEEVMKQIEEKFENSKIAAKKIAIIKDKVANRNQQLLADMAFADDFAPIDDINDEVEQKEELNSVKDKYVNKRHNSSLISDSNEVKKQKTQISSESSIPVDDNSITKTIDSEAINVNNESDPTLSQISPQVKNDISDKSEDIFMEID